MSSDANEAQARLGDAYLRAQSAIRDRTVKATNAAADVLDALSDIIEGETQWPALDKAITVAVLEANNQQPRVFVCSACYRKIDGPMILTAASPTPRMVHYPECPSTRDADGIES